MEGRAFQTFYYNIYPLNTPSITLLEISFSGLTKKTHSKLFLKKKKKKKVFLVEL